MPQYDVVQITFTILCNQALGLVDQFDQVLQQRLLALDVGANPDNCAKSSLVVYAELASASANGTYIQSFSAEMTVGLVSGDCHRLKKLWVCALSRFAQHEVKALNVHLNQDSKLERTSAVLSLFFDGVPNKSQPTRVGDAGDAGFASNRDFSMCHFVFESVTR